MVTAATKSQHQALRNWFRRCPGEMGFSRARRCVSQDPCNCYGVFNFTALPRSTELLASTTACPPDEAPITERNAGHFQPLLDENGPAALLAAILSLSMTARLIQGSQSGQLTMSRRQNELPAKGGGRCHAGEFRRHKRFRQTMPTYLR